MNYIGLIAGNRKQAETFMNTLEGFEITKPNLVARSREIRIIYINDMKVAIGLEFVGIIKYGTWYEKWHGESIDMLRIRIR